MAKVTINKNALGDYTPMAYPKLFEKVGHKGLIDIQKHDKDAAKIVSELKECDEVIYVGHSETKSNYPESIASFIDCKNGKRFYVINRQLEK